MEKLPNLNKEQEIALNLLLDSSENLHITGFAGTGKSFVIKRYKKIRDDMDQTIPIVASTGAAALLVNGVTFHSFFGIGIMKGGFEETLKTAINNPKLIERILNTKEVIVDEISMISATVLQAANLICQIIRDDKSFFGGIRMIFVGDFFQLGPFGDTKDVDWAFDFEDWKQANVRKIELRQIMRTDDKEFLAVLARVRYGVVDRLVEAFLNKHIYRGKVCDFDGTILLSKNDDVDKLNKKKLDEIFEELVSIKTEYNGDEAAIKRMKETLVIPAVIDLKVGALVMFRINSYNKEGDPIFVNGTIGKVVSVNNTYLKVKTLSGKIVKTEKHVFDLLNGDGETIAQARNYPVTLAWAITIHKAQGASIDKALISLRGLWLHGQAYTALSRLKSSSGLYITGWDRRSFIVDKKVILYTKDK